MKRVARHFLIALSSACCVAGVCLWVSFHGRRIYFQWGVHVKDSPDETSWLLHANSFSIYDGGLHWSRINASRVSPAAVDASPWQFDHFGFELDVKELVLDPDVKIAARWFRVGTPLGSLALALSIPPVISIAGWMKRRPHVRGACIHCGYDLRATPDRCPEWGTLP